MDTRPAEDGAGPHEEEGGPVFGSGKKPEVRPRVGLALGSSGIKAFSALPLIEFLRRENIEVDMVAATSGGALLAALWAGGFDLDQMRDLLAQALDKRNYTKVNYRTLLDMANLGLPGAGDQTSIYKPTSLQRTYRAIFKNMRIEDLKPRTVLTATDCVTGEPVILEEGKLCEAVYVCGAIYPLMPPAKVEGRLLVDGGFTDPMPLFECYKRNMDIIIGVFMDDDPVSEPEGIMDGFLNASKFYRKTIVASRLPLAIDMHYYEIVPMVIRHNRPMDLWDVSRIKDVILAGKLALKDREQDIRRAVDNYEPATAAKRKAEQEKAGRTGADEKNDDRDSGSSTRTYTTYQKKK